MLQAKRRPGCLLESLNRHSADIALDPLIEDLAQEHAVRFGRRRMRADALRRFLRSLDGRQKAQIFASDFAEKAIDTEWSAHIPVVHDAEYVGVDPHFMQEFVSAHCLRVSVHKVSSAFSLPLRAFSGSTLKPVGLGRC